MRLKVFTTDIYIAAIVVFGVLSLVAVSTNLNYRKDISSEQQIFDKKSSGVVLLDSKDRPFFSFYDGRNNQITPISEIPKNTQDAVISTEDKDFYFHNGFSPKSIVRALGTDLKERKLAYGGSTITQQLVKNTLLDPKKDFLRKYEEIVLAQAVEKKYPKDKILEMYLNTAYFGRGAIGIETAAKTYFGKDAKDLDLAESAYLVGLLPSPSTLGSSANSDGAKDRQKLVLQNMVDQRFINKDQEDVAQNEELVFKDGYKDMNSAAPHFAMMVIDSLNKTFGEEYVAKSGIKVKTTIDLDWQKYAQEIVSQQVNKLGKNNVTNGAAVVLDPRDGEIKALVGSIDWKNDSFGKFNVATSPRQVGSSFKPIVYSVAFDKKLIIPSSLLQDVPTTFQKGYKPTDYDGKYRGPVLARRALANSLNIPAVEVISMVGIQPVLDTASDLGITTLMDASNYGPSLVLGSGDVPLLQLTGAYGAFANSGRWVKPSEILEVRDKYDNVLFQYSPQIKQVISPESAYLISSILSDSNARREVFGSTLDIPHLAAVKTGTSQDYRDSLTVGYTPGLVVGAWVGNNDNTPMDHVAGALGAAPIWKALMTKFLEGVPQETFVKPSDVIALAVCPSDGNLVAGDVTGYTEYFIDGTEPKRECSPPPSSSPAPTSGGQSSPAPSQPTIAANPSPAPQPSTQPQGVGGPEIFKLTGNGNLKQN